MIKYRLNQSGLFEITRGELITLYLQNLSLKSNDKEALLNVCPDNGYWGGDLATVASFIQFFNTQG